MSDEFRKGALNKISDVSGVTVGHKTVDRGGTHSGVTVIVPTKENIYYNKPAAACFVLNGFGKSVGLPQIEELGTLESPIALTNTLSVGIVLDALAKRAVRESAGLGKRLRSVNSVVCECNDGSVSDICAFGIGEADVADAFDNAAADFEEGDVGAGRGTVCHGLKGGIGSASRIVEFDGKSYTVGVLLLSNHGEARDFRLHGRALDICGGGSSACDKGSIIVVVGTDLPLSPRQIKRAIKRVPTALARAGSRTGHGSGEIFLGFSTANLSHAEEKSAVVSFFQLAEDRIDKLFRAVSEATEDALLKSMLLAKPCLNRAGETVHSLAEYVK